MGAYTVVSSKTSSGNRHWRYNAIELLVQFLQKCDTAWASWLILARVSLDRIFSSSSTTSNTCLVAVEAWLVVYLVVRVMLMAPAIFGSRWKSQYSPERCLGNWIYIVIKHVTADLHCPSLPLVSLPQAWTTGG
jgi:hypothetical protein